MGLIIHVDGGSRGNPGPAGAGVVISEEGGRLIYEAGYFLGPQTNNAAEYHALIRALERAGQCGQQPIVIHSDSELLVRQLTGEYQVKSAKLAPLHRQVQMLLLRVGRWTVRHIPREQNARADALANMAMDEQHDVVVFDAGVAAAAAAASCETPIATGPSAAPARDLGQPARAPTLPAVRISVAHQPQAQACPAGGFNEAAFTVSTTLPAGLCVHAAHALIPTVLAILNTEPEEFAAVPTLTVRCGRPGCRAEFKLAPARSPNGSPRRRDS